ncbi:hypothetical protein C8Q77DRAFT_1110202 [Trametes polyzona]|nr:hypothetical protein C8Q77DRAFT_1110162 [Trametes polyzona]KAI0634162.1 hypothetical protein C8Q77DRAFT_1110202 [Trametes polyzona]
MRTAHGVSRLCAAHHPVPALHSPVSRAPPLPVRPLCSRIDDEIFEHAMKAFPELAEDNYAKLTVIDEDWMKSDDGKKRWREFIQQYEKKIKDYNFGSLIRTDARQEYSETNTIFGGSLRLHLPVSTSR